MEPAFDDRDVTAMLNAVFDVKVRLAQIGDDVRTSRRRASDSQIGCVPPCHMNEPPSKSPRKVCGRNRFA